MTKILLVEDDKSLREIYGVRLLAEGYDIVSAGDGEEALATAIKEKPDLIVSDVMMPKISGFDMLDILRSTPETKDIRVIMMTALSSEDQRDRGEKLGADRYLVKSQVGIEDVVRTVHEVLGDAPVAAPSFSSMQQPQQEQQAAQQQPQPQMQEASEPGPGQLPQPTAPFSSPRPATLGERIIHPLESESPQQQDGSEQSLADRISAELENAGQPAPEQQQPAEQQAQPEQPQQFEQQPQAQQPAQQYEQPQQQEVQQQPQMQQPAPEQQQQQFEQPQMQQPVQEAPAQQQPAPQTQYEQPQQQEVQQQPQMQQPAPEQQQPAPQGPVESPQPIQIDPNAVGQPSSLNVPPRQ